MNLPKKCSIGIVLATLALALLPSASFGQGAFGQGTLQIKITNIRKNRGKIVVEIYDSKTGWLKTPFKKLSLPAIGHVQTASFDIPYGKYAIAIYQDLNGNGESDMNLLGIPKEPIGLGNNHRPLGKPGFESCLTEFNANSKPLEINLYEAF
jgi:uncharacterized protein (DUF2141 family)